MSSSCSTSTSSIDEEGEFVNETLIASRHPRRDRLARPSRGKCRRSSLHSTAHGCPLGWLIDPEQKTVDVYRPGRRSRAASRRRRARRRAGLAGFPPAGRRGLRLAQTPGGPRPERTALIREPTPHEPGRCDESRRFAEALRLLFDAGTLSSRACPRAMRTGCRGSSSTSGPGSSAPRRSGTARSSSTCGSTEDPLHRRRPRLRADRRGRSRSPRRRSRTRPRGSKAWWEAGGPGRGRAADRDGQDAPGQPGHRDRPSGRRWSSRPRST